MYCYQMIFLSSDETLMSSACDVHGILMYPQHIGVLHTLHVVTYITLLDLQWKFPFMG